MNIPLRVASFSFNWNVTKPSGGGTLNWLMMRKIFYDRMCNVQNMKQKKRENTGSIVIVLEMIIIIIIILFLACYPPTDTSTQKRFTCTQSSARQIPRII